MLFRVILLKYAHTSNKMKLKLYNSITLNETNITLKALLGFTNFDFIIFTKCFKIH